jgi:Bacterial Ig-like domain
VRLRQTLIVAVLSAVVGLAVAPSALAGIYTWNQPGEFTVSGAGSNPEHKYGASSWFYSSSTGPLQFSSSLHGWTDNPASPTTWLAISGGVLQMVPASNRSVALTWVSPYAAPVSVAVSGSISQPNSALFCGFSWSLSDGGPSGNGAGQIGTSLSVPAGGAVTLTVTDTSFFYMGTACDTADVTLALTVASPPPAVSITSPGNGAVLNTAQPTFTGVASTAFGAVSAVTLNIYSGASASGPPIQTLLSTPDGSGAYAVAASAPLSSGVYTVQAQQHELSGDVGLSQPVKFIISIPSPVVHLNSPGGPLTTATPTLTGTAGTASGDANTVKLLVYQGSDTSGTPLRTLSGSVDGQGRFSIQVTPGLADGVYTAVVAQSVSGGSLATSAPVTFVIKVHGPGLTLIVPAAGGNTSDATPTFAGAAGTLPGDSPTVTLTLYSGGSASGKPLGAVSTTQTGGAWAVTWPQALPLGLYTAVASQQDNLGHATRTPGNTFLIVPASGPIGAGVDVTQDGVVSVPISCSAPAGQVCQGDVLVTTVGKFRPVRGGPKGHLSVMFVYVTVSGGQSVVARAPLQPVVRRALRRVKYARVTVVSLLSSGGGQPQVATATRLISAR